MFEVEYRACAWAFVGHFRLQQVGGICSVTAFKLESEAARGRRYHYYLPAICLSCVPAGGSGRTNEPTAAVEAVKNLCKKCLPRLRQPSKCMPV